MEGNRGCMAMAHDICHGTRALSQKNKSQYVVQMNVIHKQIELFVSINYFDIEERHLNEKTRFLLVFDTLKDH